MPGRERYRREAVEREKLVPRRQTKARDSRKGRHTSADQSRKPKRSLVLTACILTQHIVISIFFSYLYVYIYISSLCSFSLSLSFALSFALFFVLCIYKSTFSMKIISSAARFVALVRHSPGNDAPVVTGSHATRTSRLRVGHRPINTRTGSPVPAT